MPVLLHVLNWVLCWCGPVAVLCNKTLCLAVASEAVCAVDAKYNFDSLYSHICVVYLSEASTTQCSHEC